MRMRMRMMMMISFSWCLIILLIMSPFYLQLSCGRIFSFEMHHRYSHQVKIWPHSHSNSNSNSNVRPPRNATDLDKLTTNWPERGSYEYYADLAARDRIFRGRRISEIEEPVTFSDGNQSFRITSLGFLHYASVTLGTPGKKFLVALDTGSDLFWVPCDCSRCAPLDGSIYASDFELSIYNPKTSSTSKKVPCSNNLCLHQSKCSGTFNQCPYTISYVSAETSTSGILVEDVLHLTTEERHHELVEAYITFGCGQVQTGSFLDVAAPNGLFGLGMENISVPSILSREGFTSDSFSMCFGRDGVGRISFGDKGSPDQYETPFNMNPLHPTYNITVTQIRVGTAVSDVDFTALFDSGTSFTYLVEPAYSELTGNYDSQVEDARLPADSRVPFEFCYETSGPDANTSLIPSVSLAMEGGSQFTVYDPIIVISTRKELVYCLAVIRSTELNIIGQNFMTGYRIVFDREKFVLGWLDSDCYDIQVLSSNSAGGNATVVPPAVAAQPENNTADGAGNTHNSAASLTPHLCDFFACFITLLFLFPNFNNLAI